MAAIPDEIVERVKSDANIVDVVGDYVRLRKSGKNWVGLCPFHEDKKPSMHVEPVRGIFKCFACGEGGNVFTFLMKINGWTFPETVRNLAAELGIEIPESGVRTAAMEEGERLVAALREAARRYHDNLFDERSQHALGYFRSRGFSEETIRSFGLGYAPDEWDWMLNQLTTAGYSAQELERAGLVIPRKGGSGGFYDRFRGRALFPIFEANGRMVGFGGRRMGEDEDQPKYINSPDSRIYNKSRVLYGLYQAKESIRKEGYALFVEGYADVVSLHQAGVRTAIATCGTAVAPEHASLIARFTSRAVLIFDSDVAGEKATERGIATLIAGGLEVAVARLPDGEDPDSFVRKQGAAELQTRIREARPFIEYLAKLYQSRGDFDNPERSSRAIRSLVETIAQIPDRLRQELYVNTLAVEYHLSESLMARELERATGQRSSRTARPPARYQPPPTGEEPPPPEDAPAETTLPARREEQQEEFPPAELKLVQALAHGDAVLLKETFERIDESDFTHPLLRRFVNLILAHYMNHAEFSLEDLTVEELPEDLRHLVMSLSIERETVSDFWRRNDPDYREPNIWKVARDCLVTMQLHKLGRDEDRLLSRLREENLDQSAVEEILQGVSELGRRRRDLQALLYGEV